MPPKSPHFHRAALFILLLFFLFLLFFYSFRPSSSNDRLDGISPNVAQRLFLALSSDANATISFHLRALNRQPHLAATPSSSPTSFRTPDPPASAPLPSTILPSSPTPPRSPSHFFSRTDSS
ncbi:hypothetical protein ZIOFF_057504 [Zingiber officinale]|uniref:Uncharacterized protein n=1 Tax=Zingiber officinale TaxID=94328 RepID=A0A8J5KBU8_ZINOF|nr:hypothetical protein ZIOFF_057504 [Zingiber officinale]